MMADLPKDPVMLLGTINMKLRDFYPTLDALCEDLQVGKDWIRSTLSGIDYEYDPKRNQFDLFFYIYLFETETNSVSESRRKENFMFRGGEAVDCLIIFCAASRYDMEEIL